jgi:hypothetical protein
VYGGSDVPSGRFSTDNEVIGDEWQIRGGSIVAQRPDTIYWTPGEGTNTMIHVLNMIRR